MSLTQLLSQPSRHPFLSGSITYPTGETLSFSGDQAIAFSLSEGTSGGQMLGGTFSASCVLTLSNEADRFTRSHSPYGAQVRVLLCLEEESAPLALFTVAKVARNENDPRLILSGSDALGTAFEGLWSDENEYPLALGTLAQSIAARAGFSLDADFPGAAFSLPARPDWGEISLRQALGYTACAAGCFAVIDRSGALKFRPVRANREPYRISPQITLKREYGDHSFGPLTGLSIALKGAPRGTAPLVVTSEGAISESSALSLSGNPLFPWQGSHTQALAEALLSALSGFRCSQAKITWRGDPALCLGDPVLVEDTTGVAVQTVVTHQTLTFSQGFSMQSECAVCADRAPVGRIFTASGALNAAMLSGEMDGAIIRDGTIAARAILSGTIGAQQLAANAVTAEKISAGAVTAEKIRSRSVTAEAIDGGAVQARHLSAGAIDALYAQIGQAQIDWAQIQTLRAAVAQIAEASIRDASIDYAQIQDLIAGKAIITQGEAGQLYIARLAVTEANLVSLTVGELLVKGEDGGFYAVSVDATGQIVTEKKEIGNEDVKDASIHGGQKLIEGSVTADVLNARQIFGDSAIIRELIAANLDVDTLFSREATIDRINALDITGNESIRLYVQKQDEINVYLRVTENGLEIGKEGDPARFRADNRTLEVTNVKSERLGITQAMSREEEWAWIATKTGLGLKYIGEAVS